MERRQVASAQLILAHREDPVNRRRSALRAFWLRHAHATALVALLQIAQSKHLCLSLHALKRGVADGHRSRWLHRRGALARSLCATRRALHRWLMNAARRHDGRRMSLKRGARNHLWRRQLGIAMRIWLLWLLSSRMALSLVLRADQQRRARTALPLLRCWRRAAAAAARRRRDDATGEWGRVCELRRALRRWYAALHACSSDVRMMRVNANHVSYGGHWLRRWRVATAAAAERRATARLRWFAGGRFASLAHMSAALHRWEWVAAARRAARARRLQGPPRGPRASHAGAMEGAEAEARGQPLSEANGRAAEASRATGGTAAAVAEAKAAANVLAQRGAAVPQATPFAPPTPPASSCRPPNRCYAVRFASGNMAAVSLVSDAATPRAATVEAEAAAAAIPTTAAGMTPGAARRAEAAAHRHEMALRTARWDKWRALLRWRRRHRRHFETIRRLRARPPRYLGRDSVSPLRAKAAMRMWRGLVRAACLYGLAALHADWRRLMTALGEWRHRSQLLILYRSAGGQ